MPGKPFVRRRIQSVEHYNNAALEHPLSISQERGEISDTLQAYVKIVWRICVSTGQQKFDEISFKR